MFFCTPLRHVPSFVVLAAASVAAGCGGGGIFGPDPIQVLNAPAVEDGYSTSSSTALTSGNAIAVGDNSADDVRRGFVCFDIGSIPSGSHVVTAVLRLAQVDVSGNPYPPLLAVNVDHVNVGAAIDPSDVFAAPLQWDIGTLSNDGALTTRSLDVTAQVAADLLAGRTRTDYRLRFSVYTDSDGFVDSAHFEDAEDHYGTGQGPVLVVTYELP